MLDYVRLICDIGNAGWTWDSKFLTKADRLRVFYNVKSFENPHVWPWKQNEVQERKIEINSEHYWNTRRIQTVGAESIQTEADFFIIHL